MSRIGKKPVTVVSGVKVVPTPIEGGIRVAVEGPKGKLSADFRSEVRIELADGKVTVTPQGTERFHRAYHGTTRALIANMVQGVSQGFEKRLEIVGVGYNAKVAGNVLELQIGFCHPVKVTIPTGLVLQCPKPTNIVIQGADKQLVGEFAARVRRIRPPEPYKGKGIRYDGETVVRKSGKTFGSGD